MPLCSFAVLITTAISASSDTVHFYDGQLSKKCTSYPCIDSLLCSPVSFTSIHPAMHCPRRSCILYHNNALQCTANNSISTMEQGTTWRPFSPIAQRIPVHSHISPFTKQQETGCMDSSLGLGLWSLGLKGLPNLTALPGGSEVSPPLRLKPWMSSPWS